MKSFFFTGKTLILITLVSSPFSTAYGMGASDWVMTLYGGQYTDDALRTDILPNAPIEFEDSYIGAIAIANIFSAPDPRYQWEVEGQFVKHWGEQTHWEYNLLAVYRWKHFPWNHYLKTTAAIGNGISYATELPPIEEKSTHTGSNDVLDYFLLETTFAPPFADDWALVVRIHHRSGLMGVISGVIGGSNVICTGLRIGF